MSENELLSNKKSQQYKNEWKKKRRHIKNAQETSYNISWVYSLLHLSLPHHNLSPLSLWPLLSKKGVVDIDVSKKSHKKS